MKYKFYSINDIKKESISTFEASSIKEAYEIASNIKRIEIKNFNKLFAIEEITKDK